MFRRRSFSPGVFAGSQIQRADRRRTLAKSFKESTRVGLCVGDLQACDCNAITCGGVETGLTIREFRASHPRHRGRQAAATHREGEAAGDFVRRRQFPSRARMGGLEGGEAARRQGNAPGVIDSGTNYVERPRPIAQRVRHYADMVGCERVIAGADCGFGTFLGRVNVAESIAWKNLGAGGRGQARIRTALALTGLFLLEAVGAFRFACFGIILVTVVRGCGEPVSWMFCLPDQRRSRVFMHPVRSSSYEGVTSS